MCNFLVNRAALAYLSPMPATSSRTSHRKQFFIRTWDKVNLPVRACVNFINRHVVSKITGVFDKVMAAIHVTRFAWGHWQLLGHKLHPIVLDLYKADLHKGIANCKLLPIMLELIQDDLYIPSNQICIYIYIFYYYYDLYQKGRWFCFQPNSNGC